MRERERERAKFSYAATLLFLLQHVLFSCEEIWKCTYWLKNNFFTTIYYHCIWMVTSRGSCLNKDYLYLNRMWWYLCDYIITHIIFPFLVQVPMTIQPNTFVPLFLWLHPELQYHILCLFLLLVLFYFLLNWNCFCFVFS